MLGTGQVSVKHQVPALTEQRELWYSASPLGAVMGGWGEAGGF